jgi:hypothetical protein
LLNHKQAVFSILTLLPYKNDFDNIIVVTDLPEYYNNLKAEKIVIEQISSQLLNDWKGIHNYIFRAKIKALELVANKWEKSSLLYLDADTFAFNNLNNLRQKLAEGNHIMHLNEGSLCSTKSKTKRTVWNNLRHKNIKGFLIDQKASMWNAGVIGVSVFSMKTAIAKVLAVCDEFCEENVKMRLVEQLSFSLVLNEGKKLLSADDVIGHYWGNKLEWNVLINDFFIKNYLSNKNQTECVAAIADIDLTAIPVFVKTSSMPKRLKKMIDKFFIKKRVRFVSTINAEL